MTLRHKNLAEWLKYWRDQFDMTQIEVGEAVGVSKQHISNLERQQQHATSGAESRPSIDVVDKLARLFNRPVREARILAGYEKNSRVDTIEEALNSALFFDQKGLSESDREKLRPLLEVADREVERLQREMKESEPVRVIRPNSREDVERAIGGEAVEELNDRPTRPGARKRGAK
jgi:transcriptional regulator with XRE-family HTH domain